MKRKPPVILSALFFCVLLSTSVAASENGVGDETDVSRLFLQANQAYRDSDFQTAARCYEKIISNGTVNGEIFYNLGNAYIKKGEVGKALLNYRKAEMFIPRDEDLQTNLQYVQDLVKDKIECREFFSFLKSFCFWYSKLNNNELLTVFLISNLFFWILLTLRMFYRGDVLTTAVYALIFFTVVLGSSLAVKLYNFHFIHRGVVVGREIMVRSGNSINDTVLFKLHEGTEFRWLKEQAGWVKIRLCDEKKGWVHKNVVGEISAEAISRNRSSQET